MHMSIRAALTRGLAVLAAMVAVAVGSATSAAAEPPGPGPTGPPMACPYGLPEQMTLEQALVRVEGYATEERIREVFDFRDANDNGYYCYRLQPTDIHYPAVVYFLRDDFGGADPG